MDDDRKKRLVDLGTETLAEALLELASRNNAADDLVERLIAPPLGKHTTIQDKTRHHQTLPAFYPLGGKLLVLPGNCRTCFMDWSPV